MLHLKATDILKKPIEILAIPVCENLDMFEQPDLAALVTQAKKRKEFTGKHQEELILYDPPGIQAARVVFLGLGKAEKMTTETLRQLAGAAVKTATRKQLSILTLAVPESGRLPLKQAAMLQAMAEGAYLANHLFDFYKSDKKDRPLGQLHLLTSPEARKQFRGLIRQTEMACEGTCLARDWVSMPPNDKKPARFAQLIATLARKADIAVTILNEKELHQLGFGAMLAVSAGSSNPPRLVILEYRSGKTAETIALVGKGVTFDSGGINLKPSGSLEDMKMDMAGAAAVAAAMIAIGKIKPPGRNIIAAIPIVENMPSGTATRPGDIIKSYLGKTVEIGNTDAEGRLILVDTMAYVIRQYRPDALVDLATLTGACVVALGEKIAGVFSTDHALAEMIVQTGEETHERCWRLPLPEDYKELLKSDTADLKNVSGTRHGGAITAALFLSDFIEKTRWAHIDIAGPAFAKKASAYCGAGGTGFGVRLLCSLLTKSERIAG
ncbi:MAG: leucyl aminopeptidase [Thermodesulfobacteriota bacterium]